MAIAGRAEDTASDDGLVDEAHQEEVCGVLEAMMTEDVKYVGPRRNGQCRAMYELPRADTHGIRMTRFDFGDFTAKEILFMAGKIVNH